MSKTDFTFFIFLILVSQTDSITVISLSSLPSLPRKLTFSLGKLVKTEGPNASNYDRRFSIFFHPLIFWFPLEEPYQVCFLPYGIFLKYCEEQPTVATSDMFSLLTPFSLVQLKDWVYQHRKSIFIYKTAILPVFIIGSFLHEQNCYVNP